MEATLETPAFVASRYESTSSSPAFREWFGESVVTDAGLPRACYHATLVWENPERGTHLGDFEVFDRLHTRVTFGHTERMDQIGSWFSTRGDEHGAGRYASKGAVYPVFLRIENPRVYSSFDEFLREGQEASGWTPKVRRRYKDPETGKRKTYVESRPQGQFDVEPLRAKLIAEGFDGLLFPAHTRIDGGDHAVWVAFHANQIKSAIGNCGAFDRSNPSILA